MPAEAEIRVRRGTAADAKGLAEAIGEPIATIRSGADGQFEIALDPGSYVLEATAEAAMSCSPAAVTVPADRYVSETISCNTGIV